MSFVSCGVNYETMYRKVANRITDKNTIISVLRTETQMMNDTRKTDFAMVLVFIPFVGKQMTWPRPFTPCARCRVTKTYDIYCTPCDKYLWMEIG